MIENRYTNYILSLLFAMVFVYLIPWVELNGGEFKDIPNYLERIVYLRRGGDEAEYWGISWLFSEPLWKEIIIFIGLVFEDYRSVLYLISLMITFVYVSFLIKRVNVFLIFIFLCNPMLVNLFIEQIRISFAFALVLIVYNMVEERGYMKLSDGILLLAAFLIHTAMLVFYALFFLLYKLNERVEEKKYYFIALIVALFWAIFMKYGADIILMMVGDRRANYGKIIEASSLAFSISWFIIAMILATFAEFRHKKERLMVAYAISIMSFFFFSSILGMFAARYVAVIAPFIIIAIGYLPKHIKQGTYLFLLAYNIFAFKYWLKMTIL